MTLPTPSLPSASINYKYKKYSNCYFYGTTYNIIIIIIIIIKTRIVHIVQYKRTKNYKKLLQVTLQESIRN